MTKGVWQHEKRVAASLGDHASILRDPERLKAVAMEVLAELYRQNVGDSPTMMENDSVESEVYAVVHNMPKKRHEMIRAAGIILSTVLHLDYERDCAKETQ